MSTHKTDVLALMQRRKALPRDDRDQIADEVVLEEEKDLVVVDISEDEEQSKQMTQCPSEESDDSDGEPVELLTRQDFEGSETPREDDQIDKDGDVEMIAFEDAKEDKANSIASTQEPISGRVQADVEKPSNPSEVSEVPEIPLSEREKSDKESKKLLEKQKREKQKEQERKQRELKQLEKEAEKRKKEEEKLRIKKENEMKRELLKKEKEEKERKRLEEKEQKERKRQEEKAEKERKKQEEKEERERKRIEEKEKKEQERQKQEELKKQEEEDKLKSKKKLQISNFFKVKAVIKSSSIEVAENLKKDTSSTDISDFSKKFHDFYLKDGTILYDFKKLSQEKIKQSKEEFDNALGLSSTASEQSHYRDVSLQWLKSQSRQSVEKTKPFTATYVYENQLENTSLEMRFIKFYENVKPYHGTYTKSVTEGLPIDPFLPEEPVFLDFDDESDENEEGEGEDIDDLDDDEEEEDEEDDDIGDFLEPDSSPTPGNAKITGPLIPKISWKSDNEKEYRIEILKANITIPINPKRNYWEVESSPNTPNKILKGSNSTDSTSSRFKKAKSLITDKQDLETFAQHVNESDYTIPTMVEILKKQLPAYTKSTIENTLKSIAKRVGPKPTEKKWEVNNDLLVELSQQAAAQ